MKVVIAMFALVLSSQNVFAQGKSADSAHMTGEKNLVRASSMVGKNGQTNAGVAKAQEKIGANIVKQGR